MEKPNDLNQRINARAFGRAVEAQKKLQEITIDDLTESIKPDYQVKCEIIPDNLPGPLRYHINKVLENSEGYEPR